jgi:hypothetical protein
MCGLHQLLKVPDTVEVSMREKAGARIYFLLNHQSSAVRIVFYKPMRDYLTDRTLNGNFDLPPHGILVLEESRTGEELPPTQEHADAAAAAARLAV